MKIWKSYKQFSESYLEENRELVLNDILHQTITFILFPSLEDNQAQREQISFSLNLSFIQQLEAQGSNSNKIDTARTLMRIPPDAYFRENWNQAYPLWFLENITNKNIISTFTQRIAFPPSPRIPVGPLKKISPTRRSEFILYCE